ncbi:hypothetical protein [Nitratireductor sp. XY-223]|uniref:hypothetical protein n=1 Tax=Nitratireductor sp. XY-223 TaxID=2561926 RepID=UPI0010AAFBE7|nr:hypothetical protein [Nitratireductor sp. XY-223]
MTSPPLLNASFGRTGSSMVYRATADGLARLQFGRLALIPDVRRSVRKAAWKLGQERLQRGYVYKTHDMPGGLNQTDARIVFIFGSAVDAALSVYNLRQHAGREWVEQHLDHLNASGPFEELFERDIMRIAEQLQAWTTSTTLEVLCLRYETIWDNQGALSDFAGFPVRLPGRRERSARTVSPDLRRKAEQLYGELDRTIEELPDAFIAGAI